MATKDPRSVRLHSLAVPLNASGLPVAAPAEEKKGGLSGVTFIVVYIFGSVISSCCIVVCCKSVFTRGFGFPLTVSFFGYLFTYLYYVFLKTAGLWKQTGELPMAENMKVAAASISSISFMNLCLLTNPVAFYQIAKFVVIPCTLMMQATFFSINTNIKVLVSIAVLLGGVGYVTIDGVSSGTVTFIGLMYAALAVVGTALYRIWQETKQKEYKLGPVDFQSSMAFWQAAIGAVVAVCAEWIPGTREFTVPMYFSQAAADGFTGEFWGTMGWCLGVCVMALTVNFTAFGLIGKTGPVAYAIVGHAKTVITIIMGFLMWPGEETHQTMVADVIGCSIAMCAVVFYGHFEYCLKNNKPDMVQRCQGKTDAVMPK